MKGLDYLPWAQHLTQVKRLVAAWSTRIGVLLGIVTLLLLCLTLTGRHNERQLAERGDGGGAWGRSTWGENIPDLGSRGEGGNAGGRGGGGGKCKGMLPGCPSTPPDLMGRLVVEEDVSMGEAERRVRGVDQGGFWAPRNCVARWKVAVIVPYRDRANQLGSFLNHMHPFLQRQQLNYSIYLVEQAGTELFNRARLLNVGFLMARNEGPWDCYAFHDIDMLPLNDYHLYHCSPQPRHLAVSTSALNYKSALHMPYDKYFGGACLMTEGHLRRVNGWSNVYWGWGGEDDDMWRRIRLTDMSVWRYPAHFAAYKMISHKPSIVNKDRYKVLERHTGKYKEDGLSNLNYTIKSSKREALYTHLLVDIGSSVAPAGKGG